MSSKTLLLTGVSGHLGSHVAKQLLSSSTHSNLRIIGTCSYGREREQHLRAALPASDRLEVRQVDMLKDIDCFSRIVNAENVDYVMHTACPVFQGGTEDEQQKNA